MDNHRWSGEVGGAARLPAPLNVIVVSLVDWLEDVFIAIGFNLVLAATLVTVVLGPPAVFGLYYAARRMARGEYVKIGHMIDGGRRHLGRSWLLTGLSIVLYGLIFLAMAFLLPVQETWARILEATLLGIGIYWLLAVFYAIPMLVAQEDKPDFWGALLHGIFGISSSPLYTLLLVGLLAVLHWVLFRLFWPLLILLPSLTALMGSHAIMEREVHHSRKEAKSRNPPGK